jgi:F0F1-type ATP synthase assembly protein I
MRLAGLGMELAGAIIGGCLLGYWLDRRFGTAPRWLMVCTLIGVVGGLYNLVRQALRETTRMQRRRDDGPAAGAGP